MVAIPEPDIVHGKPLDPLPYGGPVVRHLSYHIWPLTNGIWRTNVDQIAARLGLFNGRIRVGIVTDRQTDDAQAVKDYFAERAGSRHVEFVVKKNEPKLGEVWTFTDLLEPLATDAPNEIIFRAHAKGVRREGHGTCHAWATAMYDTLLDDVGPVEELLLDHVFVGSFRSHSNFFRKHCRHKWFYAGSFYWMRSCWVFRRNWRSLHGRYWGTEAWPGNVATYAESACIFGDQCKSLYDRIEWERQAEELVRWKEARCVSA